MIHPNPLALHNIYGSTFLNLQEAIIELMQGVCYLSLMIGYSQCRPSK